MCTADHGERHPLAGHGLEGSACAASCRTGGRRDSSGSPDSHGAPSASQLEVKDSVALCARESDCVSVPRHRVATFDNFARKLRRSPSAALCHGHRQWRQEGDDTRLTLTTIASPKVTSAPSSHQPAASGEGWGETQHHNSLDPVAPCGVAPPEGGVRSPRQRKDPNKTRRAATVKLCTRLSNAFIGPESVALRAEAASPRPLGKRAGHGRHRWRVTDVFTAAVAKLGGSLQMGSSSPGPR
ncbi:unnamed protein product [Lampetra planeri]